MPNAIAYTLGQFQGWEHGRFEPDVRAAPIADSSLGKLGLGLMQGGLTALAGAVWSVAIATLLLWLPSRRRAGPAGAR